MLIQRQPACACGGGCLQYQEEALIQPRLKIGAPNYKYEQEAGRVADQVMRIPVTQLQQQAEVEEELQRQPKQEEELQMQPGEKVHIWYLIFPAGLRYLN
jgi:hypothetical protein